MAPLSLLVALTALTTGVISQATNGTILNPILPGFHPDPSCIFVPEWNSTFFCATSSFNSFPGIPIHASKDLKIWSLIGHVLNRREQLPRLAETNRSTSGIWAPTLRYNKGTFWLVTTLVDDDRPQADSSRWDNIIFKGTDPYDAKSWSNAVHFEFEGYDTEPFWDVDGKVYITGAHAWQVGPYIQQAEADLDTGKVGEWRTIWNGTGGMAPEGPHVYLKDGWYYLLAAEGGTGLGHMVTMARSRNISGPYESNPANPVLTNANTTSIFQTVGHADLFQDASGNWWAVALSTRSGANYTNYPMGRETVLTSVSWPNASFPTFTPISGSIPALLPQSTSSLPSSIPSIYPLVTTAEDLTFPLSTPTLPPYFTHWRYPYPESYTLTSTSLRLHPSHLNLTALNGNYAGPLHFSPNSTAAKGQTFISRRQTSTLFTFAIDFHFTPDRANSEFGISAFLTQNHHIDLGIVLLPRKMATDSFEGPDSRDPEELIPQIRLRGMSYKTVPKDVVIPVPRVWIGGELCLEVRADDSKGYVFSVGPAKRPEMREVATWGNELVSWGFTGVLLGAYATSNGGEGRAVGDITRWRYVDRGQVRE
ncbi:Non-reducing end alpha-L-arabinofuranosidase BoGH43B [Podospora aff. communis PSN243]|uniref:Non-reducing end alpha-L-arabinofuranosidase BoGH43B n=1 Tax=Podospora aff. communis PSN243 TaxID=3040156 RepID=A0AAV9H045_9PEZI|nr:Non-reducing end alpha-L-arabinofuranosidase BoGH43B [Podospora aff. communis PSN243]